jgi:hypothetical protein
MEHPNSELMTSCFSHGDMTPSGPIIAAGHYFIPNMALEIADLIFVTIYTLGLPMNIPGPVAGYGSNLHMLDRSCQ